MCDGTLTTSVLFTEGLPVFRWKADDVRWSLVDSIGQPSELYRTVDCFHNYWFGMMLQNKFFTSLDNTGVSEMGLKCLFTSKTGVCFGIGTTSTCLHGDGTFASDNEWLIISVTTGASRSAFSFNSHLGIFSGPDAFAGLSKESFLKTRNSVAKGKVLISACDRSWDIDTSGQKILNGERKESLVAGLVLSPPSIAIFLSVDSGSAQVVDVIPPRVFTSFHQFRGLQLLRYSTIDL